MHRELFAAVAKRHKYDSWLKINRLDENLFVWNYILSKHQLPGWEPDRIEVVEPPGWPRSIQSVWRDPRGALALVDVFECASREGAHALVVQLIARVESPLVSWRDDPSLGDVWFAGPCEGLVLFARANQVFLMRAADREPVAIADAAAQLDAELIRKPEASALDDRPTIREFRGARATARRGELIPLTLEAEDPWHEPLIYKCFSPSGEVSMSEGELVYRHSGGPAEIDVYAVAPGRGAAHRPLRLNSK
jgi:hypothetical protein